MHTSPLQEKAASPVLKKYYIEHDYWLSRGGSKEEAGLGRQEFSPDEPTLIIRVGGSLAQVKTGLGGQPEGGARGEVTGFSSSSRRRLMRLIASIDRGARPVFVTATYPDLFPEKPEKWKRDIDALGKRLARRNPDAGFLWRVEFKERKSGAGKGKVAPHFHLLVYGMSYRDLREWVPVAWWEIVASGNGDHLKVGTRVEHIYSWGGIMRYVGKYIAKEGEWPPNWTGRSWGIIGRKNLPWAVEVVISLSARESVKLVRLGRKMIRAKGRSFSYGLTWIVNTERILDYMEFLSGFA